MFFASLLIFQIIFWYVIVEIYTIMHGITLNESVNRHRYRYLFHTDFEDYYRNFPNYPNGMEYLENIINFILN